MTKNKPETYWYWLKASAKAAVRFPFTDFEDAVEALKALLWVVLVFWLRLLVLLTFPVSVPLIALICLKANREVVAARERAKKEILDSYYSLAQKLGG